MSNPLAAFRKYQKTLLAVAAVGAMLAFGVLPILSDFMGSSTADSQSLDGGAVVASWNGGQINEAELYNRRVLRSQLIAFQQGVIQRTLQRGGQPRLVAVPGTNAESNVVESILLAEEARRMGVEIGDEAVLRHLTEHLANDTIDRNELAAVLRDTTGGRLSQTALFDGLRTELAAHQLRVLANGAAFDGAIADTAVTPGQAFEYYKRINRRMEAELVAIEADAFLDEVDQEPSEQEVNDLYATYKDVFPSPYLPTPGFKEPMKAAFQWVKADFPTFLEREVAAVTEQEIQAYYEENKSSYKRISLPSLDQNDSEPADTTDNATEEANSDTTANDRESTNGESVSEPGTSVDAQGDSGDTVDQTESTEDDNQAVTDEVEAADLVEGNSGDDDVPTDSPLEDDVTEKTNAESNDGATEGQSETTTDAGEVKSDGAPADSTSDIDVSDLEFDSTSNDTEEYQPLSEVRDDIARTLARPKATDAVRQAVTEVMGEMKRYFDDYMYWDTAPEEEKGGTPIVPDLKATADRLGLVYGEIPLISSLQAEEYELGRAYELDFSTGQFRQLPFTAMGFSPSLMIYNPRQISAADIESQFVYWKVEQKDAYTPSLDEVRPSIVRYWKMKKALELAKSQGEEMAATVRKDNQSLQTVYGEDTEWTVIDTGQFTWMTFGATPTGQGAPRLSSVEGVDVAGPEFMQTVSSLKAGQIAVTQNHQETIAYVVYMKGVMASEEDLWQLFLNEGLKQPVLFMARQDNMSAATDWYTAQERRWGLKWERPPTAGSLR